MNIQEKFNTRILVDYMSGKIDIAQCIFKMSSSEIYYPHVKTLIQNFLNEDIIVRVEYDHIDELLKVRDLCMYDDSPNKGLQLDIENMIMKIVMMQAYDYTNDMKYTNIMHDSYLCKRCNEVIVDLFEKGYKICDNVGDTDIPYAFSLELKDEDDECTDYDSKKVAVITYDKFDNIHHLGDAPTTTDDVGKVIDYKKNDSDSEIVLLNMLFGYTVVISDTISDCGIANCIIKPYFNEYGINSAQLLIDTYSLESINKIASFVEKALTCSIEYTFDSIHLKELKEVLSTMISSEKHISEYVKLIEEYKGGIYA